MILSVSGRNISEAKLTETELTAFEARIKELREEERISEQKIGIQKDTIKKMGKVRDQCGDTLKKLETEQKDLEDNKTACEQKNELLRSLKSEYSNTGNDETVLQNVLSETRNQLKECNSESDGTTICDECVTHVDEFKSSVKHYKKQLKGCKKEKQDHKVMKYFMSKEVTNIRYQLPQMYDELAAKELLLQNDANMIASYKRESNQLGKDHVKLLRDNAYLEEDMDIFREDMEECTAQLELAAKGKEHTRTILDEQEKKIDKTIMKVKKLGTDRDNLATGKINPYTNNALKHTCICSILSMCTW